ncbi:protein PEAK3 [Phaethornis superciliosus]
MQVRGSSSSLDLGAPSPPTPMPDTPGSHQPRPPDSSLLYSNVGELRAHLVPRKAIRGEGAGRAPSQPTRDPLPPPLPKKHLQRADSLPEQQRPQHCRGDPSILSNNPPRDEEGTPSSIPPGDRPSWGPKKPLTKSQSLGDPVTWSSPQKSPGPSLAELTFGMADRDLGALLESPAGGYGVVLGCQVGALSRLSARIREELLGPEERQRLLEMELRGKNWAALRVLESEPCCESGDAWYFRVGFAFEQTQLEFAAKVPKPGCCSLGVQSSFGAHCSIQRLIGRFTDHLPRELVLPARPGEQMADELHIGVLIYWILHVDISLENVLGFRSNRLPEIPSLSIYSTGLKRLAMLLLHRDPSKRVSIEQARSILQVLLWGPRQELFARSKKTLRLLQSWVEVKRALLLLKFAENSVGAGASPSLEEWLCCQYFQEVTEHTLYQVTQALYSP